MGDMLTHIEMAVRLQPSVLFFQTSRCNEHSAMVIGIWRLRAAMRAGSRCAERSRVSDRRWRYSPSGLSSDARTRRAVYRCDASEKRQYAANQ